MIKHCIILLIIALIPLGLMAQNNCVDFESFEASQNWIKELNELDAESRKDSILNRIKCERFFREENEHFYLLVITNGRIINTSECRDSLLNQIKAEKFHLFDGRFRGCRRPNIIGLLIISELNKPIIDNIDELTILKIEYKRQNRRQRTVNEREIGIRLRNSKSQEFTFRIEEFNNRENYRTEKIHIKRGRRTIDLLVNEREINVITITDSENNEIVMII